MNFTPVDNNGLVDGFCIIKSIEQTKILATIENRALSQTQTSGSSCFIFEIKALCFLDSAFSRLRYLLYLQHLNSSDTTMNKIPNSNTIQGASVIQQCIMAMSKIVIIKTLVHILYRPCTKSQYFLPNGIYPFEKNEVFEVQISTKHSQKSILKQNNVIYKFRQYLPFYLLFACQIHYC